MSSCGLNDRRLSWRARLTGYKFLARCLVTVAATRIALCTLGYRRLRHPRPESERLAPAHLVARVRAGVVWAARYVPGATCLTQAVACRRLLARHGFPTTLRIGVRPDPQKGFTAHAWLLSGDEIVVGGEEAELRSYSKLADFEASSQ